MIIHKLRKIQLVKALDGPYPYKDESYKDESFEYRVSDDGIMIKDWINGGKDENHPYWIIYSGNTSIPYEAYDIELSNQDPHSTNNVDYVTQKLLQNMNIFTNELNLPFENTNNIGIPYINKYSKGELDLIIRDYILNTPGVDRIEEFKSELKGSDKRTYVLDFKVISVRGEIIWLSTEI